MSYKYWGIKLTPAVFEKLLIEQYDGKQFDRQQAIDSIVKYHKENGGLEPRMSGVSLFKSATKRLKGKGIDNKGFGVWTLSYNIQEITIVEKKDNYKNIEIEVDKEIGEGKCSIYVFYYEIYKKFAELIEKNTWPCKIGRSDDEPIGRILEQAKTAYPELPHVGIVIRCDNSQVLEKTIHQVLKARNKWIDAPGKEWFNTNITEIQEIYEFVISGKTS